MGALGVAWRLFLALPRLIIAIPLAIAMLAIAAFDSFLGLFDR